MRNEELYCNLIKFNESDFLTVGSVNLHFYSPLQVKHWSWGSIWSQDTSVPPCLSSQHFWSWVPSICSHLFSFFVIKSVNPDVYLILLFVVIFMDMIFSHWTMSSWRTKMTPSIFSHPSMVSAAMAWWANMGLGVLMNYFPNEKIICITEAYPSIATVDFLQV